MLKPTQYITNEMLLKEFVTPFIEQYFYKKLKNEPQDYIKLKLCELLKYLSLSYNTYGNIPFNDEIDEVWHFWILQTIQYQELMDRLPVKKFIHHSSNDYDDGKQINDIAEEEANRQFSFLVSYVQNFGNFTEETAKFWPMVNKLLTIMDLDLVGLNQYLHETARKQAC